MIVNEQIKIVIIKENESATVDLYDKCKQKVSEYLKSSEQEKMNIDSYSEAIVKSLQY